ncbi:glycosyltransferase family 2 protein [Bacillus chungangensis]|uniref:Glycosyltransferase involved in cell wall biosynthesis n=1 Tax=Bacillus chungangensis TaxID=587633 RepID=A0ABT9WXD4_9BACI|nr:hypothetical protein [Bacillus chungangensis]MDQ0177784.1 glycosyltransferase involved in cell wall biosynthesis [Bacillus chungangensis]
MKKVLIGTPVRQDPIILKLYLLSLKQLEKEGVKVDYFFVDDNNDELSKKILEIFGRRQDTTIESYHDMQDESYFKDERTHYWTGSLIQKVARIKNHIIDHVLKENYDYLFFVDSDLLLHPSTLQQLMKADKDIVSEIFWTRWTPNGMELPQVWVKDNYTLFDQDFGEHLTDEEINKRLMEFLNKLRKPGIYEVGGLGALTLIKRSVLEAGVHFGEIKNVSFPGEDRHFCIRAVVNGFKLFVDTHYPATHLYRQSNVEEILSKRLADMLLPLNEIES